MISPRRFGLFLQRCGKCRAAVSDAFRLDKPQLAQLRVRLYGGRAGSVADMIALNAGAGIYVAGLASTMADGVNRAREVLAAGTALDTLKRLARLSQQL